MEIPGDFGFNHQPFRWPNQPASPSLQESVEGPALWRDLAGGLAGDGEGYHGSDSFDAELRAEELLKIGGEYITI